MPGSSGNSNSTPENKFSQLNWNDAGLRLVTTELITLKGGSTVEKQNPAGIARVCLYLANMGSNSQGTGCNLYCNLGGLASRLDRSPRLQEELRQVDLSTSAAIAGTKVHAIYGDCGSQDPQRFVRELAWTQELRRWIDIAVVENACHIPMIENSERTRQVLMDFLNASKG